MASTTLTNKQQCNPESSDKQRAVARCKTGHINHACMILRHGLQIVRATARDEINAPAFMSSTVSVVIHNKLQIRELFRERNLNKVKRKKLARC